VEATTFLKFFKHAAASLVGIRLSGQALTRIALQFAIDASQLSAIPQPAITDFIDLVPEIQGINPTMDFRFRCGLCMSRGDQKASARHVKHQIPLSALHQHWTKCHAGGEEGASTRRRPAEDFLDDALDWTRDFMHLPSDVELYEMVMESDQTLEKEKEAIRAVAAGTNTRKRPKAKASIILTTPTAMEAFSTLFPIANT
jgi:hypothetical protein